MDVGRIIALAALAGLLFFSACEKRCMEVVDPGARYSAKVFDVYDSNSKFRQFQGTDAGTMYDTRCSSLDGIVVGSTLQLQATGQVSNRNDVCYLVTAQITSAPAELSLTGSSSDSNARNQVSGRDSFMYAMETATLDGCAGVFVVELFNGGNPAGIYATPVEGDFPPALLYDMFLPSTSTCQPCDDLFVTQLTKQ
jgi:hypothetical protein